MWTCCWSPEWEMRHQLQPCRIWCLDSRLLEVQVRASEKTRQIRQGCHGDDGTGDNNKESSKESSSRSKLTALEYRPSLIFNNDDDRKRGGGKVCRTSSSSLRPQRPAATGKYGASGSRLPTYRYRVPPRARHLPAAWRASPVHVSAAKPLHRWLGQSGSGGVLRGRWLCLCVRVGLSGRFTIGAGPWSW